MFNVTAPQGHGTFGSMLEACRKVTGSDAKFTWVDDAFLVEHDVRQWTEIPLWRALEGTWAVDSTKVTAVGLTCRPISDTVRDTHTWLKESGGPTAYGRQSHHGLSCNRERELLEAWDRRWRPLH